MKTRSYLPFFLFLLLALVANGCSTGWAIIPLSQTTGYTGERPVRIILKEINTPGASDFRKELLHALENEPNLLPWNSDIPETAGDSTAEVPTLLLGGTYATRDETKYTTEMMGDKEKKYIERINIHEFRYTLTDAATGEVLEGDVAEYRTASKEEDRGSSILGSIFGDVVRGMAESLVGIEYGRRSIVIMNFVARVRRHQAPIFVTMYIDGDLPELKEGVALSRNGEWDAAVRKFQEGIDNHEGNENIYKAYYDLGIAYEYSHLYERALTSLRIGNELHPSDSFASEMETCHRAAWRDRYRLDEKILPDR